MKIEVNYNELYNLGDYMEKMFEELKKDFDEINIISESLNQVLQGSAKQTISTRMKNFNSTQFSQIVNYTHLLGNEVTNCAKSYNAEDDEFAQKMKQEASRYGVSDGSIISDERYKRNNTTSGFVNFAAAQNSSSNNPNVNDTLNYQKDINEKKNESLQQDIKKNSSDDSFNKTIGEDGKSNHTTIQGVNSDVKSESFNSNISTEEINSGVINENAFENHPSKSKGMFGSFFGAVAAAMGFNSTRNKKDKGNNSNQK